jgi:hypothetical protein
VKPKGHLGFQKISNFVPKVAGKSRYPELMYRIYCLYPPGYLVQRHLCFIEGVSLEARKEFLAKRNLLRFHYTWLNAINSTEIDALCP